MYGKEKSGMQCAEFEALLAEALDGTLSGAQQAAFDAHRAVCADCALMLAEAEAGLHWLGALKGEELEPSAAMVENILRATTWADRPQAAKAKSWWQRTRELPGVAPFFGTVLQPKFAMSFGMAFFSITLVLTLSGVNLRDLSHVDLRPTAIARTFSETQGTVIRYYENIKFVYELESRVRDLKRATGTGTDEQQENQKPPEKPKPPKDNTSGDPEREKYRNYSLDEARPMLAAHPGAVRQEDRRFV